MRGQLQPLKVSCEIGTGGTWQRAPVICCITLLWLVLVVVGSLQPARPGPVVGLHREIHWLAFAGTACLLLLLSRNRIQEIRGVVATCLLGLSLEYLQHRIYRIALEWRDVRDDAVAVLVVFAVYWLAGTCKAAFLTARPAVESVAVSPAEAGRS